MQEAHLVESAQKRRNLAGFKDLAAEHPSGISSIVYSRLRNVKNRETKELASLVVPARR
jgi:hypothetical protein